MTGMNQGISFTMQNFYEATASYRDSIQNRIITNKARLLAVALALYVIIYHICVIIENFTSISYFYLNNIITKPLYSMTHSN